MRGSWVFWAFGFLAASCANAVAGEGAATGSGSRPPSGPSRDRKKAPQYVVAEVGNTVGETRYEAILDSDLAARRKECATLCREAMADWKKAVDEAKKNKEKFTEKKPVQPYVKKVTDGFPTEDQARAEAEKLRQKQQKQESPDAPPTPDPKKDEKPK